MYGDLEEFEQVEADGGYIRDVPMKVRCPKCVTVPCDMKCMMVITRMRHETMKQHLKQ